MKIPNLSGLYMVGKTFMMARRPELLLAASVTATIGTAVLAAKGGYEARALVDAEIDKRDAENHPNPGMTAKEKAQLTWQCYLPSAFACLTAVGSTAGLHLVHVKDKKAMAQMTLAAIEEIKQEAKEFEKQNLGVVSEEEKSKILEERQDKTPIGTDHSSHIQHSDGEIEQMYLIRDIRTGRDIWSNQHRIEDALIELTQVINSSGECELAHFYNHAGYASTPDATLLGWSGVAPDLKWEAGVRDDGRPFRGFTFRPLPEAGFDAT